MLHQKVSTARPRVASVARNPVQQRAVSCNSLVRGDKCKFISRTEVPSFIPRDDMLDQLYRWSMTEADEHGRKYRMALKIEPYMIDNQLAGIKTAFIKDGVKLTDLGVQFDKENTQKFEWVGRGADGFPSLEGKVDNISGKNLEIWKLDSDPVDEDLRSAIRLYCEGIAQAVNKYYAFGSCFVDEM